MKKTKLKFETLNLKFEVIAQNQLQCLKGGYDSQGIQQHYAGSYNDDSNQGNYILNETLNYSFRHNLLHVQYFPENVMLTSNDNQNDRYKPNLIGFAFQLLDRQLQLEPFDHENYIDLSDQHKPNLIGFAFQLLDRQLQLQPFDNGRHYSFDQV